MREKLNRFSDLTNIFKGRVSTLPFALYVVCQQLSLIINTTTIKDTNQEAEIFNTSLSILQ